MFFPTDLRATERHNRDFPAPLAPLEKHREERRNSRPLIDQEDPEGGEELLMMFERNSGLCSGF